MEKGSGDGVFIVEEEALVRCKRSDGKRWRCRQPAMPGHTLCEGHHQRNLQRKRPQNNDSSHNLMTWLDKDAFKEKKKKKKRNIINENQDENVEEEKNEGDPEPVIIMEKEEEEKIEGEPEPDVIMDKEEEEDTNSSNEMRMQLMEMKGELNTLREWITQSIPALFVTVKDIINALPNSEGALEKFNRRVKRSKLMAHVQATGTAGEESAPDP
ncbi:hypothetical protein KI387_003439, partial [Taxus chinensis]